MEGATVAGCACPGPGQGWNCGRPVDQYRVHDAQKPRKYCDGCQIAFCDRYISRSGRGAPICPAVVYGPIEGSA